MATDFAGNTTSGDTMSNITWTADGVSDPGDLTVSEFDAGSNDAVFFWSAADRDMFAVDLNIQNEGSWVVAVPLIVEGTGLELETVSLDVYTLTHAGSFQSTGKRDVDFMISIVDVSDISEIFSQIFNNVQNVNGFEAGPYGISADLSGVSLAAGSTYSLLLTASSNNTQGNNAGFDNLSLTGAAVATVPVPAAGLLMVGGLLSLTALRRRKT